MTLKNDVWQLVLSAVRHRRRLLGASSWLDALTVIPVFNSHIDLPWIDCVRIAASRPYSVQPLAAIVGPIRSELTSSRELDHSRLTPIDRLRDQRSETQ